MFAHLTLTVRSLFVLRFVRGILPQTIQIIQLVVPQRRHLHVLRALEQAHQLQRVRRRLQPEFLGAPEERLLRLERRLLELLRPEIQPQRVPLGRDIVRISVSGGVLRMISALP